MLTRHLDQHSEVRLGLTLDLADDSPLDLGRLVALVAKERTRFKLTPDRKLTVRFDERDDGDAIDRAQALLQELSGLVLPTP